MLVDSKQVSISFQSTKAYISTIYSLYREQQATKQEGIQQYIQILVLQNLLKAYKKNEQQYSLDIFEDYSKDRLNNTYDKDDFQRIIDYIQNSDTSRDTQYNIRNLIDFIIQYYSILYSNNSYKGKLYNYILKLLLEEGP